MVKIHEISEMYLVISFVDKFRTLRLRIWFEHFVKFRHKIFMTGSTPKGGPLSLAPLRTYFRVEKIEVG